MNSWERPTPELWLRLVRAPKLVDKIRRDWNFRGTLVKFKLEVGISAEQLQEIAEKAKLEFDRCTAMHGTHSSPETPRP